MLGTEVVVEPPTETPPGAVTWTDASTTSPAAFAEAVADVPPGAATSAEASAGRIETFPHAPLLARAHAWVPRTTPAPTETPCAPALSTAPPAATRADVA